MNIHEMERMTGVTKQNIRFYEKKGLLHPMRNDTNNYREYSESDLAALKKIKLLRMLDFSLEEIGRILSAEVPLSNVLEQHLIELQTRQQKLQSCIQICKDILKTDTDTLNPDKIIEKMNQIERNGGKFMSIIEDYKKYAAAQHKRRFSFKPDTMVMNPAEFSEALFQYANENNRNLILIKEGMYPVFELDGVEYTAQRAFDRFGATVHCSMTHPDEDGIDTISNKRKILFRFISGPYLFMLIIFLFMAISRQSIGWTALTAIMIFPYLFWCFGIFPVRK